jgi:[protein-PII] uridylyltransferase
VFDKFNIYVHIAKVSTQGERARDAFYVRDLNKNKIQDEQLLSEIKKELLKVLK